MIKNYKRQDAKAGRPIENNLTENDYSYIKQQIIYNSKCCHCSKPFSHENKPTFDRLDSSKSHTKDNIQFSCNYCNCCKSDNDDKTFKVMVQIRKYADLKHLPKTIPEKYRTAYAIIRKGITGGLSTVGHRINIRNETFIYKPFFNKETKKIDSYDTKNKLSHSLGLDFNSLYPSSFSSNPHEFMPYSNNRFLMPGGITSLMTSTDDEPLTNKQMKRAKDIIYNPNRTTNNIDELFIAEVKGYMPEEYINDYLDFPPIIRAVEIKNSADVIGDYMSNLFNEYNPNSKKEYKLVNLLNTASPSSDKLEWMAFST
jgi:hypothetical protein